MESSYAIDTQEHLVRLKVWGELTADGLIKLMTTAGSDPRYINGMPAIADYRDAHGNWDYSEIQRFRDFVVQIGAAGEVRWAAVVKPGTLVAIGHVLIVISEAVDARIKIKLFEDPASALRWIRGESD